MGKAGVEGSMGQKGVWGAWHTPTHHPPLAPSSYDISQPAGRHLPYMFIIAMIAIFVCLIPNFLFVSSILRVRLCKIGLRERVLHEEYHPDNTMDNTGLESEGRPRLRAGDDGDILRCPILRPERLL